MNATNQQLAFARIQAQAAHGASSAFNRRAHWQAAVIQLNLALECYAGELRELAKLKAALVPGEHLFRHLLKAFKASGKVSPELEELALLEQQPSSWLKVIQQWGRAPISLGSAIGRASILAETSLTELAVTSATAINVVNLANDNPQPFDEALFDEALRAAHELIDRQRRCSAEY